MKSAFFPIVFFKDTNFGINFRDVQYIIELIFVLNWMVPDKIIQENMHAGKRKITTSNLKAEKHKSVDEYWTI